MAETLAALVPMKANSERVPDKNVREFNGRPLFHWVLATLDATSVVDEIVVDTDSDRIAEEAADTFDASIIDRPERLRGDEVPMNDILLHDVTVVDADTYLQTHCTNPLLRPETVSDAFEAFSNATEFDSLFSVTPLRVRLWDGEANPINHVRDELRPTQDLEPVYEENSNMYFFTKESIERRENRIGDRPMTYSMEPEEAVDIDYPIDFRIAEFLHRDRYGEGPTVGEVVDG